MTNPLTSSASAGASSLANQVLPHFKYIQRKPVVGDYGCIAVGDKVFHRVANLDVFFAALGYTPEVQASGLQPDEFIWDRYTRDGASKSKHCLQMQIAAYLYRNSSDFVTLYRRAFEQLIASCGTVCVSDEAHCINCPMHP